jgi:hypothetical protein
MGGSPSVPAPTPKPEEPKKGDLDQDAEARIEAGRRAEDEKRRRGRQSVRQDFTGVSAGSGVFIPN